MTKNGNEEELRALRYGKFMELVKHYKAQKMTHPKIEAAMGLTSGYLSLLITKKKRLGEVLVRRLEKNIPLPKGWFDREGDTGPAFKWPFTLSSLESLERLKPEQIVNIDTVMAAQIANYERENAPRKKPGGGGSKGGPSPGGPGGGPSGIPGLPGGVTKHSPSLALVPKTPEEQQIADELALKRAQAPGPGQKPHLVDPPEPPNRDLFEK
jgi:hypothetical protein